MWYHMKSKTLEREFDEFQVRLQQLRKKNENIPEEHIRQLRKCLQRIRQELKYPEISHQMHAPVHDVSLIELLFGIIVLFFTDHV